MRLSELDIKDKNVLGTKPPSITGEMFVVISEKTGTLSGYRIFCDQTTPLDIYNEYIIDLQEVMVSLELTADIKDHTERLFYGGSSVRETVARIMVELFSNDLATEKFAVTVHNNYIHHSTLLSKPCFHLVQLSILC